MKLDALILWLYQVNELNLNTSLKLQLKIDNAIRTNLTNPEESRANLSQLVREIFDGGSSVKLPDNKITTELREQIKSGNIEFDKDPPIQVTTDLRAKNTDSQMTRKKLIIYLYQVRWENRDHSSEIKSAIDNAIATTIVNPAEGLVQLKQLVQEIFANESSVRMPNNSLTAAARIVAISKEPLSANNLQSKDVLDYVKEAQVQILTDLCRKELESIGNRLRGEGATIFLYDNLPDNVVYNLNDHRIISSIANCLNEPNKTNSEKLDNARKKLYENGNIQKLTHTHASYSATERIISVIREFIADVFGIWKSAGQKLREFSHDTSISNVKYNDANQTNTSTKTNEIKSDIDEGDMAKPGKEESDDKDFEPQGMGYRK